MTNTAFLFPGQGSQSLGMLSEMAEAFPLVGETFSEASEALGYDLWEICQKGPEEQLNRTETTQPAMLAAGIATWRCWKERGGADPDFMAGHSLGEYSALVASGAMRFTDAVSTVALRGRLMQEATPEGVGAMAAIIGLDDEVISGICHGYDGQGVVSCANFNSPGQVVIAGHRQAVDQACEIATSAGARRAIPLPVSVPSHCALMRPAAGQLKSHLESLAWSPPAIPVIQNADVQAHDSREKVIDALARQLWQPVRWTETVLHLAGQGVGRFVECGPGKVLAGLNRRISRPSAVAALTDPDSLERALEEV